MRQEPAGSVFMQDKQLCLVAQVLLHMLEKSDWPYKAHKARNDCGPYKLVIIYKKLTIIGL